ncbi:hypothetical protein BDZ91DRAFT_732091, partial [Kalaharituber pfeilii]
MTRRRAEVSWKFCLTSSSSRNLTSCFRTSLRAVISSSRVWASILPTSSAIARNPVIPVASVKGSIEAV